MVFFKQNLEGSGRNEQSASNGEGRGQRNNESWYRVHERELQRNHERGTLLNYSEIRQLTSRFIGYLPENELMMMTPNEWKDWIIGGQDKYLDQKELMIQVAQANGLVQANKSLKRMTRDIERQRYEIRNPGSYERIKRAELEHEKRRRELFKSGTKRWLEQQKQKGE